MTMHWEKAGKGVLTVKKDDTIRALIDAYTELAESQSCLERNTMEALLDIFDPK